MAAVVHSLTSELGMDHGPDIHKDCEPCGLEGVHVALASGKCWKLLLSLG